VRWAALAVLSLAFSATAAARPVHSNRVIKPKIGQSATIRITECNYGLGCTFRVTLLRYVDPVPSSGYTGRPPRRTARYVLFAVRLKNLSKRRWQGTPMSYTQLQKRNGTLLQGQYYATYSLGTTLEAQQATTYLFMYEISKKATLKAFRYVGTYDAASWALPR
jgi:hypothetical protein